MTDSGRTLQADVPQRAVHVLTLDGARGIAILLVLIYHAVFFGMLRSAPTSRLDKLVYLVGEVGWVGVDLFFVLSGFLITRILLDAKGERYYFRNFYIRRALRIFPLYYGALVLLFFFMPLLLPREDLFHVPFWEQMWWWSYTINISFAIKEWHHLPLVHFWSLAVEEQFYLLWPVVVFVFRPRSLMLVCGGCIISSLALRIGLVLADLHTAAYVLMPARMDALAVGAFLALVSRGPQGLAPVVPRAPLVMGGCALGVSAIMLWRGGLLAEDAVVNTLGLSLIAVMFGAGVAMAYTSRPRTNVNRLLTLSGLRLLGRYSYGMYVFHMPIIQFFDKNVLSVKDVPKLMGSQLPGQVVFTTVVAGATLILAVLSWHFYEQPFLRFKALFPYHTDDDGAAETGVSPQPILRHSSS